MSRDKVVKPTETSGIRATLTMTQKLAKYARSTEEILAATKCAPTKEDPAKTAAIQAGHMVEYAVTLFTALQQGELDRAVLVHLGTNIDLTNEALSRAMKELLDEPA